VRTTTVCARVGLAAALVAACACARPTGAVVSTEQAELRIVTIAGGLEKPWSLAFLPSGDVLVTELRGDLRLLHNGRLLPQLVGGVPLVETRDQAGLMDIALHPRFADNHLLYLTYSKKGPAGNTPALARARFDGARLADLRDMFVADAWSDDSGGNTGSRVVFGPDGTLYMSIGERHEQTPAQDMGTHKGKIVRLNEDGRVPADNPFTARAGARPEIFALGVRNPQGLFFDTVSGALWENEHGPLGGDELNLIAAGRNYGWPSITYGKNYDGTIISNDTARDGMEQPLAHWVPSISPSGLVVYHGDRFPAWRGNIFEGALSGEHLRRLVMENGKVTHQEVIDAGPLKRRIRDVREGPDGLLYLLTDAPGAVLRLEPR